MRVEIRLDNPRDLRATLTCTMTLAQWGRLNELLKEATSGSFNPDANAFIEAIRQTVDHASAHFDSGTKYLSDELP